jgi:hypothetical protein
MWGLMMNTTDKALAEVTDAIARHDTEGAEHYELDGRLARLTGGDLMWSNPYWEAGIPYAEQPSSAQEYYSGWVAQNLALRRADELKRAKAA